MLCRSSERVEVLDVHGSEIILNMSAAGAAFRYPHAFERNQTVRLTINEVIVEGRVVYCHKRTDACRIGVRFTAIQKNDQSALTALVESFSCGVPLQFSLQAAAPALTQLPL
jgi:hypothetical protein